MTVIVQSKFADNQELPAGGNWLRRGVKRVLGAPYFSSAYYTLAYDADLAAGALEPYARGTIGLVGRGTLPVSMIDCLRGERLPKAKYVDATDMVDQIKVRRARNSHTSAARPPCRTAQWRRRWLRSRRRRNQIAAVADTCSIMAASRACSCTCTQPATAVLGQPPPAEPHAAQRRHVHAAHRATGGHTEISRLRAGKIPAAAGTMKCCSRRANSRDLSNRAPLPGHLNSTMISCTKRGKPRRGCIAMAGTAWSGSRSYGWTSHADQRQHEHHLPSHLRRRRLVPLHLRQVPRASRA
jgi:hypothetical protein